MKKMCQEGGGVGLVVVSQLKFQTLLSLTEIFQPQASKGKLDNRKREMLNSWSPFLLWRGARTVWEKGLGQLSERGKPVPLPPVLEQ